jgi:class 3 adenylate cyclase
MAGDTQRRERKVVTVVFCDLVGFTAQAESLDPEDVAAILRPYHERVRSELERHGGTVEKFIGDAVMALFGAPTAHEDDPERAVRASLAIREFALEEGLELRVGVTTGEALVSLDARPDAGEGMASGDVVNTAARLQSAAPVNGILVDETTYRATRSTIDYDDAEPVEAKGKAAPIPVWRASAARSRLGVDVAHEARSELIGRERELAAVRDAFDRARHARTPQLVTLVGVPGIGKSRLVYELQRIVDADPELITWRQGRCLAYGDGVTLWALGEIVKAEAGVLDQDTAAEVAEKLRRAAVDALPEGDVGWVESHLLALAGLAEETQLGGDRRDEAFSAWRRFLEGLAEQRPLVLVFEDLHWADEVLLDFVDELVDWLADVPLLVVTTARPELLERRPSWGGGKLNASTLALAPLTDEQTAQLLGDLLRGPVPAAETQAALLERAGGNPLYAEQFAELYVERGSVDDLELPETLQGIIAARLDGLGAEEKALVLDAAVVGKVFWTASLARDERETTSIFRALERKGFVRRQRRSSVEGETELAFAHALVRDVAYGQIPRADRAQRHRRVAEWIESLGRPEDHAELRAYHWRSALDLARASGSEDAALAQRARLSFRDAGDRAAGLNSHAAAAMLYEQALELSPDDDPERPGLLFRRARALFHAYDERREEVLETARDALLSVGDIDGAAEADVLLAHVAWDGGDGALTASRLTQAEQLVGSGVSAPAARVLSTSGRVRVIAGELDEGRSISEAALAMAEHLQLNELRAHSLATVGMAKNYAGDRTGLDDMQRARAIAQEIDSPISSSIVNNIGAQAMNDGELDRAAELFSDAVRLATRFGDRQSARFVHSNEIWLDFLRGHWQRALDAAETFIAECEAGSPHTNEWSVRTVRGSIRAARGEAEGAIADLVSAVGLAEAKINRYSVIAALALSAAIHAEQGLVTEARRLAGRISELVHAPGATRHVYVVAGLAIAAPHLDVVGDDLRRAVAATEAASWRSVATCALKGDLGAGADILAEMGTPTIEAEYRFHAGRQLTERGARSDGETQLEAALDFYRSVGATQFVERGEAMLATTA